MSNTYYYRLSGKSAEMAEAYGKLQLEQRAKLKAYIKTNFPCVEECYSWHGQLLAIPAEDGKIPPHFKAAKCRRGYMSPRESTKEGKTIAKEWNAMKISTQDTETIKFLGVEDMQFDDGSMACYFPSTFYINGNTYLITAKACTHPECEEVTLGHVQREIDADNEKAKGENQ